ncbi:hypothetical protein AB0B67_46815, partial [Streptomyces spectabilis]
ACAVLLAYWAAPRMTSVWFYRRESAQELGVPLGLLAEVTEVFDFGRVGVDDPGSSLVVELVGGDPATLDPAEERDAGHADRAGEVGRPPLVGAESRGMSAEGLFLVADAAEILQELAHALGAEAFAAFGRAEAFRVQDLGDGRCPAAASSRARAASCG